MSDATGTGERALGGATFRRVLVALTLLGAALRAVHLDGTIGFDEAASVRRFVQGGPPAIFGLYSGYGGATSNHLLNSLLTYASARAFGPEVWALRLPSFLFGCALVPLAGLLALRMTRERGCALFVALLVVSSPILVAYSPASRGYASLLFFVLASTWFLLGSLTEGRASSALWLVPSLLLVGWSHMSGLIFVGALGLIVFAFTVRARWRPADGYALRSCVRSLASVSLATLGLVAWYSRGSSIVHDVGSRLTTGEFQDPSLAGLKSVVQSGMESWLQMTGRHFFGEVGVWLALPVVLAVAGVWSLLRQPVAKLRVAGWVSLGVVLLTPILLLAGRLQPVPRYFLFIQPFLLIWIAAGALAIGRASASALARSPRSGSLLGTLLAAGVACLAMPDLRADLAGPGTSFMGIHRDVQAALEVVAAELEPADLVLGFNASDPDMPFGLRGFWQVFGFHEQLRLAPLLSAPRVPGRDAGDVRERDTWPARRLWYVTPLAHGSPLPPLAEGARFERIAGSGGVQVYRASFPAGEARLHRFGSFPRAPAESLQADESAPWSFYDPFGGAAYQLADTSPGAERGTLEALWSGAVGELVSAPVDVESGRLVEVSVEFEAAQSSGLRPFGRVILRFLDGGRGVIGEVTRLALLWPRGAPSSEVGVLRLATLVPEGAMQLEVRLGLADGTHTGDRITFRLPRLWLR